MDETAMPMPGGASRLTPIDYDAPIAELSVSDLMGLMGSMMSSLIATMIPQGNLQPQQSLPTGSQAAEDQGETDLVDRIATRVIELLEQRGVLGE
jgi:hypothetical protein